VCGVNYPFQSSAEIKERAELYFNSPLGINNLLWGEFYLHVYVYYTKYPHTYIHICIYHYYSVTIQAMYVQRNILVRSQNHFCRGKAISITYFCLWVRASACVLACVCLCVSVQMRGRICVRVRVALLIQHATCMRHIVLSNVA
jgi:hypothetical protein